MRKKCISCGTPPQPYYTDKKNSLTQDHAAIFRDTQFAAGIQIKDEFVVPQIGEDIQVSVKNLVNLVLGSYIWNPSYGYLKIVHWDSCEEKIGLLNEDITGAAIPGTVVSAGSLFIVTSRPCCADQDNFQFFPFLAEDFIIPAVSDQVTLQVTSTYGLIEGTDIRIGSYVYYLDQINSSLEIVVTNQGAGGTPGGVVEARDVNGDLQYLITQAIASACISSGSDTVKLLGCDGANEAILEGDFISQVPVLQDPATSEVEFRLLDTEVRVCSFLTDALNVSTLSSTYTINVDDETVFPIGSILQINFGDLRWEVTDNTTPGELDITSVEASTVGYVPVLPGSNFTVPSGSSVCIQLTVDEIEAQLLILKNTADYGWRFLEDNEDGTYISATSFSIPGDQTGYLKIGQKIRLFNTAAKYFNIESFSFGAGVTTINVIENLDYSIANVDITNFSYSLGNPPDFPAYFSYDINAQGFASFTFEEGRYWVIDSTINGMAYAAGVSDSLTFLVDIPAPFELDSFFLMEGKVTNIEDNGAPVNEIGTFFPSGVEVSLFTGQSLSDNWTSSGDKAGLFTFSYVMQQ